MLEHCCKRMADAVNYTCEQHPDPFDCPDNLIYFEPGRKVYGLIVHDGGCSYIRIRFCPWCGAELSRPKHRTAKP
jgi:hypothetical protein